jgi:hypothetical protein
MAVEKFTRNISVSGKRVINGVEVLWSFNVYNNVAPTSVGFEFTAENGSWCTGSISKEGLTNYSATRGVISDALLQEIVAEGTKILANYATV